MESISPVPYGTYAVDFNCDSGYWMTRSIDNPDAWNVILTLNDAMDGNADGIIELKFRANSDWGTNWGGDGFPTGVDVTDADVTAGDIVEVFFDGNKSGGAYDASDVHVTVTSNGTVTVVQDPAGITVLWASYTTASGYSVEVGIPFAAHVVDAVVEGTGNPWDNDAVEMYVEGDNSKDGTYSAASFDTQLIMDAINLDSLWAKADGVPITDESSVWLATSDGYSIEIRLGWSNLDFAPGKGRTIGWSLGNNDSDLGVGRDYQSVWYGNGNDWSDNMQLGDLELAGDPYFVDGLDEHVLYNANVILYPNPTAGNVNIRTTGDVFNTKAVIFISDITGRSIATTTASFNGYSTVQLNTGELTKGIYFVNILSEDGKRAVKKLIVQ